MIFRTCIFTKNRPPEVDQKSNKVVYLRPHDIQFRIMHLWRSQKWQFFDRSTPHIHKNEQQIYNLKTTESAYAWETPKTSPSFRVRVMKNE